MFRSPSSVTCIGRTSPTRRSREEREIAGGPCARCERPPASAARRAFTLIELLVVLGIIMILISLLASSLRGARDSARTAVCLNNHREIGKALAMYANAYRDIIPREGSVVEEGQNERERRARLPWPVAFRPLMDNRVGFDEDPNDLFVGAPYYTDPSRPKDTHNVHYVVNAMPMIEKGVVDTGGRVNYWRRRGPESLNRLRFPSETLYLTEFSDDADKRLADLQETWAATDMYRSQLYDVWDILHIQPGSVNFRIGATRHGRGGNALFLDTHAETVRKDRLTNVDLWDDRDYGIRADSLGAATLGPG